MMVHHQWFNRHHSPKIARLLPVSHSSSRSLSHSSSLSLSLTTSRSRSPTPSRSLTSSPHPEVYATFPCTGSVPCGLMLGRYGKVLVDPPKGLVTLDLTAANNSAVRAGPIPPSDPPSQFNIHLYIDHTIIELIVNNATAFAGYWAPPAVASASLVVELTGGAAGKGMIEGWTLIGANNVSKATCV